jgi:hypothetical protein
MSIHPVYEEVLRQMRLLSPEEQTRLVEETMAELRRHIKSQPYRVNRESAGSQPRHKAREFRGVGRETWKDVDVEEYLRQERASWDR